MRAEKHVEPLRPADFAGPPLRCSGCGYDLRGLRADGRCPECNQPVSLSIRSTTHRVCQPVPPVAAAPGVTCVRCRADVGGYPSDAACPACAAPVWLSLDGDWLCVRDPTWLAGLRRGVSLWIWATLVSLIAELSRHAVARAAPWIYAFLDRGGSISAAQFYSRMWKGEGVANLMVSLLDMSAILLITAPHPGSAERGCALRRCIRILLPLAVGCSLLSFSSRMLSDANDQTLVFRFLSHQTNVLVYFGALAYARSLGRLLPDPRLVRGLGAVLLGFGALWLLDLSWYVILYGGSRFTGGPVQVDWRVILMILPTLDVLLFVTFGIWLLRMLVRFRRALREIQVPDIGHAGVVNR